MRADLAPLTQQRASDPHATCEWAGPNARSCTLRLARKDKSHYRRHGQLLLERRRTVPAPLRRVGPARGRAAALDHAVAGVAAGAPNQGSPTHVHEQRMRARNSLRVARADCAGRQPASWQARDAGPRFRAAASTLRAQGAWAPGARCASRHDRTVVTTRHLAQEDAVGELYQYYDVATNDFIFYIPQVGARATNLRRRTSRAAHLASPRVPRADCHPAAARQLPALRPARGVLAGQV